MKQERIFMIVKLEIKNDEMKKMSISFNDKSYDIDFSSDEKDIFHNLNKDMVENIKNIENLTFVHNFSNEEEKKKVKYKVAHKIASTYLEEINKIKEQLNFKKIELDEKLIND